MQTPARSHARSLVAFTLIELLVVVAIIALLISILLPALGRARDLAKTTVCATASNQLILSNIYYYQENKNRMPLIVGTNGNGRNAPYNQWYQIIYLYPYMKDLKLFRCPGASGDNSVKSIYGLNSPGASVDPSVFNGSTSLYFVRKSDSFYEDTAYRNQWWPDQDPVALGSEEEFPELYTEYWYNDYSSVSWTSGQGLPIRDVAGQPLAQINGGNVEKFVTPSAVVPLTEYGWWQKPEEMRHQGGINLAFLDGHVSKKNKSQFYDLEGRPAPNYAAAKDWDAYGTRPFYVWGTTKNGGDFLR